jgi:uncharacterized Zn-finger protein
MKTHEGKLPFECKTCSKQFLHASTLEIHRKAHHHVEHERVYKCPSEGCSFKGALSKGNLVIHYVRRHCHDEITKMLNRTETTFQCKECNKEMKSATAFHYHSVKCLPVLDSVRQKELETIIV